MGPVAADEPAGRAARAWLMAAGLGTEIAGIAGADPDNLIPAPGLAGLLADAELAARDAHDAAERARTLSSALETGDEVPTIVLVIDATADAEAAADRATRDLRQIAQLGMGVSARCPTSSRVERLDRACVAVLYPPDAHGPAGTLADDGLSLTGTTGEEVEVELAGAICRLLTDRADRLVLGSPAGEVTLTVDADDNLIAELCPAGDVAGTSLDGGLSELGWPPGSALRMWRNPVTVIEPASVIVSTLTTVDHGVETITARVDPGRTTARDRSRHPGTGGGDDHREHSMTEPAEPAERPEAAGGRIDPYGGPHAATANLRPATAGWPPTDGTSIVYGVSPFDDEHVWFVPESTADALARAYELLEAPTWGELRRRARDLGDAEYQDLLGWFDDPDENSDDDPFEPDAYPGHADGDFPPHPGLFAPAFVPRHVAERFFEPYDTTLNGTYWYVDPPAADDAAAALEDEGYTCRRDDAAVISALAPW